MSGNRITALADAIAGIDYDDIVAFDRTEPEYGTIESLRDTYDQPAYVELLVICATTADYQLNGDAQEFWRELERVALDHNSLDSTQDVQDILGTFMEADVNARLADQKRDRLVRLFENGFDEWFLEHRETESPLQVWEQLADGLNAEMRKKTVVLSMKIFDIARLEKTLEVKAEN